MRNDRLRTFASFIPLPFLILVFLLLASCVARSMITTRQIAAADIVPASYTVIRYSNLAVDYLTTVAFLDREDDAYTIVPQGPEFAYTVSKGLKSEEALRLAEDFVRSRPSYNGTEIKAIMDPAGNLLGYEVRPLYQLFVYGQRDVLDIAYFSRPENKIEVWIRLRDRIERLLQHDSFR